MGTKEKRADALKRAVEAAGMTLGIQNDEGDGLGFTTIFRDGSEVDGAVPLIRAYYAKGKPTLKQIIAFCQQGS